MRGKTKARVREAEARERWFRGAATVTCPGYTKANRAQRPEWSNPWCPIHRTKACPDSGDSGPA